jgi:hypothetical protein
LGGVLVDNLFFLSALVYYAVLSIVYLARALDLTDLEWKLSPIFSLLLIPFVSLWTTNLLVGNDSGRLIAGLPIIVYLVYDLWYRLVTRKKPHHHPERWPVGLVVYLVLLMVGSIGLNSYGYLMSDSHGFSLVISFFVMMGFFGYYRTRLKRRERAGGNHRSQL